MQTPGPPGAQSRNPECAQLPRQFMDGVKLITITDLQGPPRGWLNRPSTAQRTLDRMFSAHNLHPQHFWGQGSTSVLGDTKMYPRDNLPVLLNPILLRRPVPNFSDPITFAAVHMNHASESLIRL